MPEYVAGERLFKGELVYLDSRKELRHVPGSPEQEAERSAVVAYEKNREYLAEAREGSMGHKWHEGADGAERTYVGSANAIPPKGGSSTAPLACGEERIDPGQLVYIARDNKVRRLPEAPALGAMALRQAERVHAVNNPELPQHTSIAPHGRQAEALPKRRIRVYIAGPYSKPDPCANTNTAMIAWDALWVAGYAPYCPHWSHFQHTFRPRPYEDWLAYDLEYLRTCDVLVRLPGESSGADAEVAVAQRLGLRCMSVAELLDKVHPLVEDVSELCRLKAASRALLAKIEDATDADMAFPMDWPEYAALKREAGQP